MMMEDTEECPPRPPSFLATLPKEILVYICSFLDAKFLVTVVREVNSQFASVIDDPSSFRIRAKKRWPAKYPPINHHQNEIDWMSVCIAREEQNRSWSNPEKFYRHKRLPTSQGISVDAVLVTKDFVVSGSRDRSMSMWNIHQSSSEIPFQKVCEAHTGWIWDLSISEDDGTLYSSSWDTSIKMWDIRDGRLMEKSRVKCTTAVLSTVVSSDIFVAGTFDKKVTVFDRNSNSQLDILSYHRMPVLALSVASDYIISGSEDQSVVFFDRRAKRKIHSLHFQDSYPMSMTRYGDALYIGDKGGSLHLVDVSTFQIVKTYTNMHESKITGVHVGLGSIITCSADGTIQASQPDLGLDCIGEMKIHETDEITGLSVDDSIFATGHEGCVQVWTLEE